MANRDGITERKTKSGEVRFLARWLERGKRHSKTFPTRAEAEDFLRLRKRGRTATPATLTVAQLVDEVLARSADRLSERTVLTYRSRAEAMILPHLGERRLIDLETLDVQRWIDGLRDTYQPATIHAAVAVLFGVLREATALGIIERNVAQGIRRPRIPRKPMTVWTADEARRFLAYVRSTDRYAKYVVLWHVALATGMRPGELRALKWADVDLERGVLHVRRTVTKNQHKDEVIVNQTKRGKGRAVAIPAHLVAMLKRHKTAQTERRLATGAAWWDLDLVFDRGDGHWVKGKEWIDRQRTACKRAGVPRLTLHELRHTAASLMLEQGVHPKVTADILGHASVETTLDIYSWVSDDLQRKATESLGDALFEDEGDDQSATVQE